MLRCIQLGKKGIGTTAPNPMVGCVIVHKDQIIGEGFTSPYGGNHAEVNAIKSVKDNTLLSKATLYVSLEPCSHFGKTPPCTDIIIEHKIPEVYIGLQDPHDKVAGKGIEKLKASGCNVTIGILEKDCRAHHKRFLCFQEKKRPYVVLKWAETQDCFIAPDAKVRKKTPEPVWITNTYSKQLVHKWRSEEQAILVGTNTVLEDNPKLTVRNWEGKHPIRVVIDKDLKIPSDFHVLDTSAKTIVFTQITDSSNYLNGIDYELIDFSIPIGKQICSALYKHSIISLLIEGGSKTLQTFIDEGLWDEARIFKGPTTFKNGVSAPKISGRLLDTKPILSDSLSIFEND
jgi:diaminohydroxyphosphoribosylaminopyrimidine deaminase/5-amino-6-(5-phosphoribosylamino)uracil reductase